MRMNEEIMERKDEEEIHKLRNDLKNYNMLDFLKNCKEGLFQFEIGVQSTNQKTLDAMPKQKEKIPENNI